MTRYQLIPLVIFAIVFGYQAESYSQRKKRKVRPPTSNRHFNRHEFNAKDGSTLIFYLMTPAKIDSKKKYPLVLTLHGRGGNTTAASVLGRESMRKKYPCFVMAPMSPRPARWAAPKALAKKAKSRPEKMSAVIEAIEVLKKKQPIDANRIYVTGQSMGGFGSFGAVARNPKLFAAAVPICGGWAPGDAKKMADTPFWIFHGDADTVVSVSWSQKMVKALKAAGGKPKYTEYAGVKHNSWTKAYGTAAMWEWMFSQKRNAK